MTTFARILITLISCLALATLGTGASASAHPRHVVGTGTGHHPVGKGGARHAGKDWCC